MTQATIDQTRITPQLAADIRTRRQALGWSQEALGDAVGYTGLMTRIENGVIDEHELLPDVLALLDAGELPQERGPQPVGHCDVCQILLYGSAEDLPDGASPIMVDTGGLCRACAAEGAGDAR